jgi:hypothetical protein
LRSRPWVNSFYHFLLRPWHLQAWKDDDLRQGHSTIISAMDSVQDRILKESRDTLIVISASHAGGASFSDTIL